MKSITIFTPTFNRGYCLINLYKSLCKQNSRDFKWLIIDDGSSDDTKYLVQRWKSEDIIEIEYYYQENKGKLAAQIHALEYINSKLFTCIDSDDILALNAIENIINFWNKNSHEKSSGIIGLDSYNDGSIAGTKLPDIKETTYSKLIDFYKIKGDKKYIFNTKVYKKFLPYSYFEDEKFHEVSSIFPLIDQTYQFLISNEIYCIIEYQNDGLSNSLFQRYKNSPKSFIEYRKIRMIYGINFFVVFKNSIHYVSSNLFLNNFNFVKNSPKKLITILAIPFGIVFNIYIRYRIKNHNTRIQKGKLR